MVRGNHGSFVVSRVVFGDIDYSQGPPNQLLTVECSYYDVLVARSQTEIEEKSVVPAMAAVVGTAPDLRVFNLSFDNALPIDLELQVNRREKLILVQDLDNFIFAQDVLVIVAAGNSRQGLVPSNPYPQHTVDPQWGLGTWSRSFNTLTCGSFVGHLSANGLVSELGAPSPFTRIGPGLCKSPKPDFAANGGNGTTTYQFAPGLGVWGCTASGLWEDWAGISFSTPILAREAAFAVQHLQGVCEQGAKPFAVTVKAFLALTAVSPNLSAPLRQLAELTLGRGQANSARLMNPLGRSAVMLWQGVLENASDIARVQIPIPLQWLNDAGEPLLRIVLAWDTLVNAAVHDLWASRRVIARLRPHPDAEALRGTIGHQSYPMIDRLYNLARLPSTTRVIGDTWLLEVSYEQIADYYPAIDFSPQQRVGFALELFDGSANQISPQPFLQSLPITATMQRLSVPPTVIRSPIVLKSRV